MGYADYLSPTLASRKLDQKTFKEWEEGKITIDQAFNEYVSNNRIKQPPLYHKGLFEFWLNGLGYRRTKHGSEKRI